ncbi:MAG: response regulator [Deltaproteobacteria bacterium]|nr:response regulator [Deltaproteobacteria bacterium]MCL5277981.1 response regulator [Deltaproteobacteria bacterium]
MGKKILLADDSITIQKVISITFSPPDYEITIVDNGNDAIKKATDVRPDIVLTDIVMPGKNGYEVCDAIKGNAGLQNTPVLLLTGAFEAFDEQKARQSGADAWLSKPFETQALIDKVNTLLSKPAVKKPAEARPSAPKPVAPVPPTSRPGVPPPPPPRRPAPISAPPPPPPQRPAEDIPKGPIEGLKELSEEESFGVTEDTIGDESGWETIPLGNDKEASRTAEEKGEEFTEKEFPLENVSTEQIEEPAPAQGSSEEGLSVGFGDLEAAMEEEGPGEEEHAPESYEKTYDSKDIPTSIEEQIGGQNEAAPPVGLSREELLEQASSRIESMLQSVLPDKLNEAIQQAVEQRVDALVREVAEKIIWEVVPALTETMIKEEIQRLKTVKKKP